MSNKYYVYLLKCRDGSLYTGITNDVARRFQMHRERRGGRYTRAHGALKILHTEEYPTKSAALRREIAIKRLSRERKFKLAYSKV